MAPADLSEVEGIAAVTSRISEIKGLLGSIAPPAPAAARPAAASQAFARTLAEAASAGAALPGLNSGSMPTPTTGGLGRPPGLSGLPGLPGLTAPAASGPTAAALKSTYQNGRIPAEALAPIGRGNHRLAAPAAAAFTQLEAAAKRDGITIGVTDSYRSYESQVDLARRKGLYSEGGLAAKPGTSDHGWGLALDLDLDPKAQAWMRAHGATFGFVEDTPREPWHWGFKGVPGS